MNQPQRQEAYLDIVWRQFVRNRFAYVSLWLLVPMFLLAIYAPLIASNQPFVFVDDGKILFPWWHALFNPTEWVDLMFNMAMLVSLVYVPVAVVLNVIWKRRGVHGRQRLGRALFWYVAISLSLLLLVLLVRTAANKNPKSEWLQSILPKHAYRNRDFGGEEFASDGKDYGWYAPLPFGPGFSDLAVAFKKPLFRKPMAEHTRVNDGVIHWLGTDNVGRDVLMLMIYGTRISMTVGFVAVSIYLTIGCFLGAVAGYFGGWIDILISRTIEIVLLFPAFFLILTLVAMLEPSIYIIMAVIGITGWPTIARLIRGEVLKQRSMEYAVAAKAIGASQGRIIFRHILPNALSPALVAAPFGIASAIITEAGLSLLGFGVSPPTPSWGQLLHLANSNYSYWWLIVFPSLAIFFTVTIFNLVGSGLRDAMDPRLRRAA